jgi:hypothetical protein
VLKLVTKTDKPKKPVYCPRCNSSVWIYANMGRADYAKPVRVKVCLHCLAKGEVVKI